MIRAALAALLLAGGVLPAGGVAAGAQAGPMLGGVEVAGAALVESAPGLPGRRIALGGAERAPDGGIVRPMTVDTPVRIASISKLFVALAIHRLADAGKLRLDDDVSPYLGWTLRNPAHPEAPITIRQMLRHHSSLSDAGGYYTPLGTRLRDLVTAKSFSAAAPGAQFDYANLNLALLGEVIEHVTGERFDRAMQRLVLRPLGLEACYNWSGCTAQRIAAGGVLYRKQASEDGPWNPAGPWIAQIDDKRPPEACAVRLQEGAACDLSAIRIGENGGLFAPQGGLRISVADLARAGRMLAENRDHGGRRFLKPATWRALFRPVAITRAGNGEETDRKLMQYWSEGGLHCFSGAGRPGEDQPLAPRPMAGCGHLGNAWGLVSGLVIDPQTRHVRAWAITGSAAEYPRGENSRFTRSEEDLLGMAD